MTSNPVVSDEVVASIESVSVDMNSFTSNEMIAVEEYFDLGFEVVAKAMTGEEKILDEETGKPIRMGNLVRTLAWIKLTPDYPGITIEQAGNVPLSLKIDGEPDGSD